MIALSIAGTWLVLSVLGFAGLSALGRAEQRESLEVDRPTAQDAPPAGWSNPNQAYVLADSRSLIAKALDE
jgi:hypothetical protein